MYCGLKFNYAGTIDNGKALSIEHIYPTSWMIKFLNCSSRMQCRDSGNKKFALMEADLHNLYPIWFDLHDVRHNSDFGEIEGEDWRFDSCDFERRNGTAEPRPLARGNVARSIFYMHREYGAPIDKQMLPTLKEWNRQDPPSTQEIKRNNKIEEIQGRRNPFIDNPALTEKISIKH
ncbi:MAG: endonuclease [Gammaproteobacteria bacterium]